MKKPLCIVLLLTVLAGCATDSQRTKTAGTLFGAGAGAGVGALLGAAFGGERGAALGAKLGALLGGTAGFAWGNHVASKKEKFASEEDYLDAVITSAREVNDETRQYNVELQNEINRLEYATQQLARQYEQKRVTKMALQEQVQEVDAKRAEAKKQLAMVESEIQIQQRVLQTEQKSAESVRAKSQLANMEAEIAQLEKLRSELEQQIDTLATIGARVSV